MNNTFTRVREGKRQWKKIEKEEDIVHNKGSAGKSTGKEMHLETYLRERKIPDE